MLFAGDVAGLDCNVVDQADLGIRRGGNVADFLLIGACCIIAACF